MALENPAGPTVPTYECDNVDDARHCCVPMTCGQIGPEHMTSLCKKSLARKQQMKLATQHNDDWNLGKDCLARIRNSAVNTRRSHPVAKVVPHACQIRTIITRAAHRIRVTGPQIKEDVANHQNARASKESPPHMRENGRLRADADEHRCISQTAKETTMQMLRFAV